MIKNIFDIKIEVDRLREEGIQKGLSTGFKGLDELYTIRPDSFTIVLGAPTHGKSEVIFEILINQADRYEKKSIILSPESGNAAEITLELIHKRLKQTAYKSNTFSCDDSEYNKAFSWVAYNFAIADDEEKCYSFKDLMREISAYEKIRGCRFDYVMAEPWNELDHKLALNDNSGRQDLAIEDELTLLRRYCKNEQKHVFLSFHPSFQTLVQDPVSKIKYYEMPRAREAAGGQATLRKAFSWINIWRPPVGIKNEHGIPYTDNELLVQIEKSKPKGVGKKGQITLYFDWQKNRYYEKFGENISYAFEHDTLPETITSAIQPSISFDITSESIDQLYDNPF